MSPVSALLAVSLAAVMFVDDTDLIFASNCEEETAESFIDKVQDGITDWTKGWRAREMNQNTRL